MSLERSDTQDLGESLISFYHAFRISQDLGATILRWLNGSPIIHTSRSVTGFGGKAVNAESRNARQDAASGRAGRRRRNSMMLAASVTHQTSRNDTHDYKLRDIGSSRTLSQMSSGDWNRPGREGPGCSICRNIGVRPRVTTSSIGYQNPPQI